MQNVLVYLEPHPIRNTYIEFIFAVPFIASPLRRAALAGELDFRIFSNEETLDQIAQTFPELVDRLIYPTEAQTTEVRKYEGEWDDERVALRTDLVRGHGTVTQTYLDILTDLHEAFPFDAIVTWSDNGAIKRFVAEHPQITALYAEIGPTRSPFHETVYFDPQGTNGAASVLSADLDLIASPGIIPALSWPALADNGSTGQIGAVDAVCSLGRHNVDIPLPGRYVYIPLQLADDINTLCHSPFGSPLDFLQQVLPRFVDQGLSVLLKGHPASVARVYNLVHETRALQYAKTFGDKVVILDRSAPPDVSIGAFGQAAYVCTINSSVGFEALLSGKEVITVGDAVYDVGLRLQKSVAELEKLPEGAIVDPKHRDRLASFLCRHYLHPQLAVQKGDALLRGLRFVHERRGDVLRSNDFWRDWVAQFDFGGDLAMHRQIVTDEPIEVEESPPVPSVKVMTYEERGHLGRLLFKKSGRPHKLLRVFLFSTSGRPRRLTRFLVLQKGGKPRRRFRQWMSSAVYQSLPKAYRL